MIQAKITLCEDFLSLNDLLNAFPHSKKFFMVDSNTHEKCLPHVLSDLDDIEGSEIIEIPNGEENKSIDVVFHVWKTLNDLGADRKSVLINVGGGVITDFGGFVASTYKRGIPFVNIPTSLLAMVDASVGGKTGINLEHHKNMVGTFSQPEEVFVFPHFLQTLPHNELVSGFGEMLKHGLIRDKTHWKNLCAIENLSAETVAPFIEYSYNIKKEVVLQDPTEKGLRKILNFGHTLGHAVESWSHTTQNPLLHGEAVAIGMILEAFLSWKKEFLSKEAFDEIFYYITQYFNPKEIASLDLLMPYLVQDKKNESDEIRFVKLNEIGKASEETFSVENALIEEALNFYQSK